MSEISGAAVPVKNHAGVLHVRFPNQTDFNQRTQEVELDYIRNSEHAQASICEQFVGVPL